MKSDRLTLSSESQLSTFLDRIRQGTWPHADWTHAAHVILGASFILAYGDASEALVRQTIRAYNESVGTANTEDSGYHETLTMFWLSVIREHLRQLPPGTERLDAVRSAVSEFGERTRLFEQYYSFNVVKSREARQRWIAPDRLHLATSG